MEVSPRLIKLPPFCMMTWGHAQVLIMVLALQLVLYAGKPAHVCASSSSDADTEALLEFKQAFLDPQHFLSDWQKVNGSFQVCRWRGVSCDESQRVSGLNLTQAQLSGQLPESTFSKLLLLDHLKFLYLSNNSISGSFTGSSLMHDQVKNNSTLQILDLSFNNFSGEVPHILDNCNSLESIDLSYNLLSGGIPSSLAGIRTLRFLNLASNRLSGEIPSELASLCGSLQELDLSNNSLSGSIPVNFSSCASIVSLQLSRNNFSGGFPDILGKMHKLEILRIDFNMFEGMIPSHIANLTRLGVLDISSNLFSGSPQEFCGRDSSLTALYLTNNKFIGPVPTSIANCTNLQIVDLGFNAFGGNFPPQIFEQLVNLEHLVIWYSGLSGLIPPEIGRCTQLKTLIMSYSFLEGPIPSELFNCKSLRWISLSSNQLSGPIPPELSELKELLAFEADNNSFTGHLPKELENCTSLVYLDLRSNQLDGVIPPKIGGTGASTSVLQNYGSFVNNEIYFVKELSDSCKGFGAELIVTHGIRDEQLADLPMLKSCKYRIYKDVLTTYIFEEHSLVMLDLSYNKLVGGIPQEIGNTNDLLMLDLSHNLLNGSIPSSFGQLQNLQVVDLSYNQLQGNIPAALSNLTFLRELNLSNNHLSGPIPAGGQLSEFPSSVYCNNDLCGFPLGPCRGSSAPQPIPTPNYSNDEWELWRIILLFTAVFFLCTILLWMFCTRLFQRRARANKIMVLVTSYYYKWKSQSSTKIVS